MKKSIVCYGVRDYEIPTFEKLGKEYDYNLILKSPFLTNDNVEDAFNNEIVMVRGNCFLSKDSLTKLKEHGLKYLLTRTAGYNHIDIQACKELGIEVAFVPGYSPNAISELALTLSLMLLRHTAYTTNLTHQGDFRVTSTMFSREIRECTVGILGCGRIGLTTAKLFKGLGAKVVGYDVYQYEAAKQIVEFLPLDEFLKQSDIISCHMPYIKGQNENFINEEFISKMKDHAILVNTARGEVLDLEAAVKAIENNKLDGLAIDVIANEKSLFFKNFENGKMDTPLHQKLIDLYPRILITPHVASSTDKALNDMIEVSLQNMDEYLNTGKCKNSLIK